MGSRIAVWILNFSFYINLQCHDVTVGLHRLLMAFVFFLIFCKRREQIKVERIRGWKKVLQSVLLLELQVLLVQGVDTINHGLDYHHPRVPQPRLPRAGYPRKSSSSQGESQRRGEVLEEGGSEHRGALPPLHSGRNNLPQSYRLCCNRLQRKDSLLFWECDKPSLSSGRLDWGEKILDLWNSHVFLRLCQCVPRLSSTETKWPHRLQENTETDCWRSMKCLFCTNCEVISIILTPNIAVIFELFIF